MHLNSLLLPLRLAALLLVASAVSAQSRPSRALSSDMAHCSTRGVDNVFVDASGWVSVATPVAGALSTSSFQSGVTNVGGYEVHGSTRVEGILVAGSTGSNGRVEYWTQAAVGQAWVLNSQYTLANADFGGIAHDGMRLFLLDAPSSTILVAYWAPGNSVATLQPTFYCGQQLAPELALSVAAEMMWLPAGSCSFLPGPGLFVSSSLFLSDARFGHLLRDSANGITSESFHFSARPGLSTPVVDEASAREGDATLSVYAANSVPFTVKNGSGQDIGNSSASPVDGMVQVTLSESLVAGQRYEVHSQSGGVSSFTCVQRYGFPEAFASGESLDRMRPRPEQYHLGNANFAFECGIKRSQIGGAAKSYIGVLIAGFDYHPIIPFDNGQGVNQLLVSEYWFGAEGYIDAGATRGMVTLSLPIPSEPSLEGTLLLAQFGVVDGQGSVLSEVIGFKLVAQ